ncbi:DUF3892 domain-containing protein [Sporosarcina thermotolerans]|uniref:DUF3892 domain-containing protein n=1 Tax=Sporosarcina thermotolerans TaxID=633404 RepID=A0AAW9A4L8_9BACL|nr:DUF3892 domain-containing protein [Sporosarcina thermotolerans]MDW0116251.1 DUF3892 domain-containing protein [Sporosarcina thermotolerans]WHT48224.1 DUF3892 domain-containing protein [Sporosarcina thermotolerans]
MFAGISILIVLGIIFKFYRATKIIEDFAKIWSVNRLGLIISIVFTTLAFTLIMNLDGWISTVWNLLWLNLLIWNRTIRYIPLFILRFAIILIPFTLAIDALMGDIIFGESADLGISVGEDDIVNSHFVNPHDVSGYTRGDGTVVEGYYRDGDGNTDINLSKEDGGGYIRTNPDGDPSNNLNS